MQVLGTSDHAPPRFPFYFWLSLSGAWREAELPAYGRPAKTGRSPTRRLPVGGMDFASMGSDVAVRGRTAERPTWSTSTCANVAPSGGTPTHRPSPEPKTGGRASEAPRRPFASAKKREPAAFRLGSAFRRLPRVRQRQHTSPPGRPSPPVKPAPRRCKVLAGGSGRRRTPPLRGSQP